MHLSLKSVAVSICVDHFMYPEKFMSLGISRQKFDPHMKTLSSFGQRIGMKTVKKNH